MSLNIHVIKDKILSENWFVLRNMTYELTRADGSVVRHKREVYDRGNGATVLLYNRHKQTVVLVRQFRVATCPLARRCRWSLTGRSATGKRSFCCSICKPLA